jgi:hypothetical protein
VKEHRLVACAPIGHVSSGLFSGFQTRWTPRSQVYVAE